MDDGTSYSIPNTNFNKFVKTEMCQAVTMLWKFPCMAVTVEGLYISALSPCLRGRDTVFLWEFCTRLFDQQLQVKND